jgi:hypothetical protein
MSNSGAEIRSVAEVDPVEMERRAGLKEWIARMAYVQESLDRELGNRT